MILRKCSLLIVIFFGFMLNSFAEDIDPVFSVIDGSNNSNNSQDTLPDTYEESPENDVGEHVGASTKNLRDKSLPLQEENKQNSDDFTDKSNHNLYKDTLSAKITALNKITAKSQAMIVKVGEAKFFGNIEIKIHRCLKNTDPYLPENKILLSITENKVDEDQLLLFQGWMMSSNIAASTFEHAVYEVFSEECL